MKGLRRILKIPPIFIDRAYKNQNVFETLKDNLDFEVDLFSSTWLKRKLKLVGHILRTNPDDPLRQVCMAHWSQYVRIFMLILRWYQCVYVYVIRMYIICVYTSICIYIYVYTIYTHIYMIYICINNRLIINTFK